MSEQLIYTEGRPDFPGTNRFGITRAKHFPKYVYSANKMGCLIHKIAHVELHWWEPCDHGVRLVRRHQPRMIATTICGSNKFIEPSRAHTCAVPRPDAVLCGRCHGEPAIFPRNAPHKVTKEFARDHLGCIATSGEEKEK